MENQTDEPGIFFKKIPERKECLEDLAGMREPGSLRSILSWCEPSPDLETTRWSRYLGLKWQANAKSKYYKHERKKERKKNKRNEFVLNHKVVLNVKYDCM